MIHVQKKFDLKGLLGDRLKSFTHERLMDNNVPSTVSVLLDL